MPTVDDLVISLRIEPSSNLGKLQKQLTALVGEKGDKQIALGLDSDTKRDLRIIKNRIVKFTPSVLMDENLKEGALALAADLKKDTGLRDKLTQKYGINIVKYENLVDELVNISLGISELNSDQQKIFIARMDTFRKLADTTKGKLRTTIIDLTKMLLEKNFHRRIVAAFREVGVGVLSKAPFRQITKESLGKSMDETIKRLKEDDPERFAALVKIFTDNADSLEATSKAYKLQTKKNLDITKLSQLKIYETVELHKIIAAQASVALTKSQNMQDVFYRAGVQLFTKKGFAVAGVPKIDAVISKISQKTLERLGAEHLEGDKITDDMINIVGEFKTVLGQAQVNYEAEKRLDKQKYNRLFLFAEEFTPDALERIRYLNELPENKLKQIGAYKFSPRSAEILLGTVSNLEDKLDRAEKAQADEEGEKESLLSPMDKLGERTQKIIEDMPTDPFEQRDYLIKVFDMQEDLKREMTNIVDIVKADIDQTEIDRRAGKETGIHGTVKIEEDPTED